MAKQGDYLKARSYNRPMSKILLILATVFALGPLGAARAQDATPVRMVVPYPPGGPTDLIARAVTNAFAEELGRPVVIENRAGASGMIGAAAVSKAAPDGQTLLINPSIHVILPSLVPKMAYDAIRDFTHVGVLVSVPLVLAVTPALPVQNVDELVAYLKRNPGRVNFASSSAGSSSQLGGEQFKLLAGIDMQHVPYKGSAPAITDLMGGRVQLMFDSAPSIMPFVKSGKVRGLAVTSAQRSRAAPELRPMAELGFPTFNHSNWYGVWGPPGMSPELTERLVGVFRRTMQRPALRERLVELGADPVDDIFGTQFEAFARSELARFAKIVKDAQVKLD